MLQARCILVLLILANWSTSWSEVTLDGTLGSSGTLDGPNFQITENLGRRAGSNLYHSFGSFNLNRGESATFSGSSGINNVISRVTGGSPSSIDGTLRSTIPNANLYFLNPAGVIFGANATLDVQGSFHVSTADYLKLGDGNRFSALTPNVNQVLTTAAPEAFGFLGENPSAIRLAQAELKVPNGKSLSVIGGDIDLEGGQLIALGGRIDIASVSSNGEVVRQDNDLSLSGFEQLGNIDLTQSAKVNASGEGGGAIFIRGGELTLNESVIRSDTLGASAGKAIDVLLPQGMLELRNGGQIRAKSEGAGKGSDLQIEAQTIFLSDDGSDVATFLNTQSFSTGNGGNIKVTTDSLEVVNGAEISAKTFGAGNGGDVLLDANSVMLSRDGADAGTGVFTVTTSTGNAGDLTIQSNSLDVNAGASIFTTTLEDSGRGGVVLIETESLRMSGLRTQISATSFDKGNSQDIIIKTGSLELRDGAVINTTVTEGTGKSANLLVEAKDIVFTGFLSGILGGSVTDSDAGNVTLIADNLEIQNGAGITTPALGKGSGGDITVTVENLLLSDSGSLITKTDFDSHGDSGSIIINADNLEVRDRGLIDTSALGTGNSGDLLITADNIVIAGGNLLSSASFKNSGDAGAITIKAENLEVRNGSGVSNDTEVSTDTVTGITSSTSGGGRSGDITIEARNILLSGKHTGISASTLNAGNVEKTGDAGTITFVTDNLELRDGTRVNTSTFSDSGSSGNGGDIVVTAGNILLSGGGSLEALTGDGNAGNAGNIDITTDNLEVRQGSDIATTTRGTGSAGDVAINAGTLLLSSDGATDFTGIRSSTTGAGSAGDIRIEAKNVQLSGDESSRNTGLFSNSLDVGDAGAITIAADDSLRILDGASISVIAKSADAGDITISADNLLQLSDGQLTTSVAEGTGNGGNILIGQQPDSEGRVRVPDMTVLENSEIIAQAEEGNGGKINITSDFIFRSVSTVDASTGEGGIDGTVNISSPETNISGGIIALPETYINASEHLSERCAARSANVSSFVVKDRSTIRPGPEDASPSTFFYNDSPSNLTKDTMANRDRSVINNQLVTRHADRLISSVNHASKTESGCTQWSDNPNHF